MDYHTFKKNKKAEPALVIIILLALLILTAIALIWRIVFIFVNKGAEEISYKTDCLKSKLEIIEVNNNSNDNLILTRGTGYGRLIGIRIFLDNQSIENMEINISEMEEKAFTIQSPLLNNNPNAVGKYLRIQKLVGENIANTKTCEFDGKSAERGIRVIST